MKILAIWERPRADEKYGGIFCLLEDGRFLHISQERESDGRDAKGSPRWIDTGNPESGPAFYEEDRFDFKRAHYWMAHFGEKLVKDFRLKEEIEKKE